MVHFEVKENPFKSGSEVVLVYLGKRSQHSLEDRSEKTSIAQIESTPKGIKLVIRRKLPKGPAIKIDSSHFPIITIDLLD